MQKRSRNIAAILSAGVLGAGILGSAAMAAVPANTTAGATAYDVPGSVVLAERDPGRRAELMTRVLHGLVEKGVITKDQAEQIARAFAAAAERKGDGGERGDHAKRFLGNAMKTSAEYLGLTGEQLKEQLKSGKSLAKIAATTPGKSRDGLIAALTNAAEAEIKAALAAGKITPAQAEEARTPHTVAVVKRGAPAPPALRDRLSEIVPTVRQCRDRPGRVGPPRSPFLESCTLTQQLLDGTVALGI